MATWRLDALDANEREQNQISWIRRRDWHILSSGAQMYTNDERFAILHTPGSNTWTLQIKFVQRRDHGTYECQLVLAQELKKKFGT
uniref:IGv domain-containing protein n=1 Tax=Anopheles stephensi TaxID=30069 RepID=A0A182YKB6_ANOST